MGIEKSFGTQKTITKIPDKNVNEGKDYKSGSFIDAELSRKK